MTWRPDVPGDLPVARTPGTGDGAPCDGAAAAAGYARHLADAMPALVMTVGHDGAIEHLNRRWFEYTGLSAEQSLRDGWLAVIHEDDRSGADAFAARRARDGNETAEFRLRAADGTYRWHAGRVSPLPSFAGGDADRWVYVASDIDDRKRADERVDLSIAMYRGLSEALPTLMFRAEASGLLTYASDRWYDYTGLPRSEDAHLRDQWRQAVHPDDQERIAGQWRAALASGRGFDWECRLLSADRGHRWHAGKVVPVAGAHGDVVRWLSTLTDVHERRRTEESQQFLAEASARFAASLDYDATLQAIADLTVPGFADWAHVYVRAHGDLVRRAVTAFREPPEQPFEPEDETIGFKSAPPIDRVLETGQAVLHAKIRADALRAAGMTEALIAATIDAGITSAMLLPLKARGEVIGALVLCMLHGRHTYDAHDLRTAEDLASRASAALDNAALYRDARAAQRAESEARGMLDTLIDSMPVGLGYLDRDLHYLRVNDALAEMNGSPAEAHRGRTPKEMIPRIAPVVEPHLRQVIESGEASGEFELSGGTQAHADEGHTRIVSYHPVRSAEGDVIGVGAVISDITERREAERRHRLSELRYRTLANSVPQIVWTADADGRVDYRNDRWYEYSGLSRDDPDAQDWEHLLHPDDVAAAHAAWQQRLDHRVEHSNEARFRRYDGEYRWFLCSARPLFADDGAVLAWFGTCLDIDDRKRSEAQQRFLSDASKLLGSSIDYMANLDGVARLAVPAFADWCAIDVLEDGALQRVAVAHADPQRAQWGRDMYEAYPSVRDGSMGAEAVLRAGQPKLYADIDDATLQRVAVDARHLELLREARSVSSVVAPIAAAGHACGVITFTMAESERHYREDDLALVEELGRRVAVAIANARSFNAEHAARAIAERAEHRVRFLADASKLLSSSLDYDKNIKDLAHIFVPKVADWCAVDVVEGDELRRIVVANANPKLEHAAAVFTRPRRINAHSIAGPSAVVRSGKTLFVARVGEEMLGEIRDKDKVQLLREGAIISWLCVPLSARGRTIGAFTLVTTAESGRELGDEQRDLAEEVAGRAAMAVDNALLFAEASRTATELRVANQAKDEFLGLVSHELRTPITTIFGNAHVLQARGGRLDEASRQQALLDIEQESERLHRIIDNLLVLSRLDAGRRIDTEPLIVERTVRRIVANFGQRHAKRSIEIDCPARMPPVAGEPVYFEQVLRNLLSNADKYSPAGTPIVVRVRGGDADVAICVRDRGKGIEPDEAEVIFRAFFRSPRTAAQASGAGIGLAVCKRLVEAQGGRVWARPRKRGGAEFGFALPVEQEANG